MDDSVWHHITGAQSKRPAAQGDAPTKQPMRAGIPAAQRKAPTQDQKRVRRQMARNASTATTSKESSTMSETTEADLLAKMASATTLGEQQHYSSLLEQMRNERRDQIQTSAGLDWDAISHTDATPAFTLAPTTASLGTTASDSDWLNDLVTDAPSDEQISIAMKAEASLWYEGLWSAVKEDREEFSVQARNASRRAGSQFGLRTQAAASVFLSTVSHLHAKATGTAKIAFDEVQKPPYGVPSGSSLPQEPKNDDTFDGLVNGEDGNDSGRQKSSPSMTPSLGEGDQPEGDTSSEQEGNLADDNAHDKAQGTGYTDPLPSGGKGASLHEAMESLRLPYRCDNCGKTWTKTTLYGGEHCPKCKTEGTVNWEKKDSGLHTATEDPKSTSHSTPSLSEGGGTEGDHAESPIQDLLGNEYAKDNAQGTSTKDYIDGQTYSSLTQVASSIQATSTNNVDQIFAQALSTMSSLEDQVGGFTGHALCRMLIQSERLSPEHKTALQDVLDGKVAVDHRLNRTTDAPSLAGSDTHGQFGKHEGGNTCATCGDKIAKDPSGEDNSTWHHDNGEKHDHEAKPGGSKESSKTASSDCPKCDGYGNTDKYPMTFVPEDKKCKACGGSGEVGSKSSARKTATGRPLYQIAEEVRRDWKNVNYAAKPYLDAMGQLDSMTDSFYEDDASTVVAYFLSNARSWSGETAKRVKAELKAMQDEHRKQRRGSLSPLPHHHQGARKGPGPQEGDTKCSKCHGKGWTDWPAGVDMDPMPMPDCDRCKGTGIEPGSKSSSVQVNADFASRVQASLR